MKKKLMLLFSTIMFVMATACSRVQEEGQVIDEGMEDSTMPIEYSTHEEAERRLEDHSKDGRQERGQNLNGHQENLPPGQAYNKGFYNEEAIGISEELNQWDEIRLSQVYASGDRVIVSLWLNQEFDDHAATISDRVYARVQELTQDKEVLVYTGDIYWNQMRDRDAKEGSTN
ncbi:YhcN/YlaJ family sporulation lipoprotein [Sediminibacillus albus]|uniref:Sporulation lipoprotein YhcN/YlaJ (Spore_YhcN_YlaJ) n=1 Tax=Sediminibacillus albus TaxID=407036 RepID=A0A1G9BMH4_9BACI|nr:YhcN/YlaJ family sporulation lipoprotein [Sediminibacillus albus]SDK40440.1 Sporulation lipoprotein YhcN/YlaJ (Spore_YhcN_YlaJ) [Sediminibacillus albus]